MLPAHTWVSGEAVYMPAFQDSEAPTQDGAGKLGEVILLPLPPTHHVPSCHPVSQFPKSWLTWVTLSSITDCVSRHPGRTPWWWPSICLWEPSAPPRGQPSVPQGQPSAPKDKHRAHQGHGLWIQTHLGLNVSPQLRTSGNAVLLNHTLTAW